MNENLDSEYFESTHSKRYSILSFGAGIFNVILFLILSNIITERTIASGENLKLAILLIYCLVFSAILGSVFTFLSFNKKESAKILQWIGTILNILFVVLIIASLFVYFRGLF